MEKEVQLRRCCVHVYIFFSFWNTEGYFDLGSDNSCCTWENFWIAISFNPGRPQGRCLVDLKVKSRYLIPEGGPLNGQASLASSFYLPVSLAFLARHVKHWKRHSNWDSSQTLRASLLLPPTVNTEGGRKPQIACLDSDGTVVFPLSLLFESIDVRLNPHCRDLKWE